MKPSELLRAAKERIVRCNGYTCVAMKDILEEREICHYLLAEGDPSFLRARNFLWKHRTSLFCAYKGDAYWDSHEERIKGITKAIADAEAAGE